MWTSEIRRLLEAQLVLMKGRTNLTCITHQSRSLATPSFSILHTVFLRVTLKKLGVAWGRGYYTLYDHNIMLLCE